ncbi:hypothetical protein ABT340_36015 [Streptosporangium sp. NPDC000239]|uniref:hypothetical protein n=1 Tax=Streptosporangium sp. NPDC000239 TaxID=3154248 RepID=UPI003318B97C
MRKARAPRRPAEIHAAGEQVFRFFPDGVVLDVLVKPAPGPEEGRAIATWLNRDVPLGGVHVARYDLRDGVVSFTTRSHFLDGAVEARGTWRGGRLVLDLREAGRTRTGVVFTRIWPA